MATPAGRRPRITLDGQLVGYWEREAPASTRWRPTPGSAGSGGATSEGRTGPRSGRAQPRPRGRAGERSTRRALSGTGGHGRRAG